MDFVESDRSVNRKERTQKKKEILDELRNQWNKKTTMEEK